MSMQQDSRQGHFLSACPLLSESDLRLMIRKLAKEENGNTDKYNFVEDDFYTHEDTTFEVFK